MTTAPFVHLHELPQLGQILVIKHSHLQDPSISILYRYDGVTLDAGMRVDTEGELNQTFKQFSDKRRVKRVVELFHQALVKDQYK